MYNKNFYPSPPEVIEMMLQGIDLTNKNILEPHGGKGDIVDYIKDLNIVKNIQSIEIEPELRDILGRKCEIIGHDFLETRAEEISHIDVMIMNPPFDHAMKHIIHAWDIAPEGCTIISILNAKNLEPDSYDNKKYRIENLIKNHGVYVELGDVFSSAERRTNANVGMITLFAPITSSSYEFNGFFAEEKDLDDNGDNGIVSYNVVKDVVQRYVGTMQCYDEFMKISDQMSDYIKPIGFNDRVNLTLSLHETIKSKEEFSKSIQKKSWEWVINKMNVSQFVTSGVMSDINKFVETQTKYPFTMKNIYRMIDMIIQTRSQTMDRSVVGIFDEITKNYHENRYNVEGWKTNSHYLMGEKFIIPDVTDHDSRWDGNKLKFRYNSNVNKMQDLHKVMLYLTGERFKDLSGYMGTDINNMSRENGEPAIFGQWYDWGFFEIKGFKKGTLHVKFKNRDHWAAINRKVSEIHGYPLPESIKK